MTENKKDYLDSKERVRELVSELFSGELPGELGDALQGWLAGEDSAVEKGEAVKELFYQEVKKADKPNRNTLRSLREMEQRLGWTTGRLPLVRNIMRAAAVLLPIALVVGAYFWFGGRGTDNDGVFAATYNITVPAGEQRHIVLADGTEVSINGGSKFSYNDGRGCSLEGEAYFRVAKDKKPFIVRTGNLDVTVLGTEFNLSAYPGGEFSTVSLYTGVVRLDYEGGRHRMEAGTEFRFNNSTRKTEVKRMGDHAKPRWLSGEKMSRAYTLGEIFTMIESAYGVTITGKHIPDTTQRYNFMLERENSIDTVMSAMRFASGDFDYTIDGNTITLEPVNK